MNTPRLMDRGTKLLWDEAGCVKSVRRRRPRLQLGIGAAEKAAASRITSLGNSWTMPSVMYIVIMEMPMTITDAILSSAITVMINVNTIPYLVALNLMGASSTSRGSAARCPKPQPAGAEMTRVLMIVNGKPFDHFLGAWFRHLKVTPNAPLIGLCITIYIILFISMCGNWFISMCNVI